MEHEQCTQNQLQKSQETVQEKVSKKYQILSKLGSGAYGHVWKARHKSLNQLCAIKKVFLAFQNQVDSQRIYRQVALLKNLKHDNIIKLHEVIPAENSIDIYLVFELSESDLFNAIKDRVLNDLHRKYVVYQLAKTLKYVHSAGILHRDLKPSNILINSNCQIKLCDFGLARTLNSNKLKGPIMTQFIATRWYRSPEVIFGSTCYGEKSDMWSLGCLIYELYTRRTLLPGEDTIDQIVKMLEFKGMPSDQEKKSFRVPNLDKVLEYFQIQKIPIQQYFSCLECEDVKAVLVKLLQYNPEKRWSASDLLNSEFLAEFKNFENQTRADKKVVLDLDDNCQFRMEEYRNQIYQKFTVRQKKAQLKFKIQQILKLPNRSAHINQNQFKHSNQSTGKYSSHERGLKQLPFKSHQSSPKLTHRYAELTQIYNSNHQKQFKFSSQHKKKASRHQKSLVLPYKQANQKSSNDQLPTNRMRRLIRQKSKQNTGCMPNREKAIKKCLSKVIACHY